MEATDKENLTIGGFEVDVTVKSHPIPKEVLAKYKRVCGSFLTMKAAANHFGLSRDTVRAIRNSRSCHPDSYIKILTALYGNEDNTND